jgi:oligopeptide/dipeptide ABC transporter ATP-binding protein
MVLEPRLLLCDEPVSALDASSRNHVLRTLGELRERTGLAILVISHDLASLAGLADRVVVLYRGRIVEEGPIGDVLSSPGHPYTALLVASAPHVARARLGFDLEPHQLRRVSSTSAGTAAAGCVFAPRCRFATEECRTTVPPIRELEPGRRAACFHAATWPLDARAERIPA